MTKSTELIQKELKEGNDFLYSLLRSFEDIKQGRVKKFEFTKR